MGLLHKATKNGDLEKVKALLAQGANVNDKIEMGTSLHVAAMNNAKDIAALLIANGADVNAKNNLDMAPLHVAAGYNALAVAELLLDHGADVNVQAGDLTPLNAAEHAKAPAMISLLKSKGGIG